MKKIYTGIGSRELPEDLFNIVEQIGYNFAKQGYILRSGGAPGSDIWFQRGCERYCTEHNLDFNLRQEIYLPWNGFNGLHKDDKNGYLIINNLNSYEYTLKYHPNKNLKDVVKKLMNRNAHQIMGKDLNNPTDLVICWTRDGSIGNNTNRDTGGTGQALRIAYDKGVPIYNLKRSVDLEIVTNW